MKLNILQINTYDEMGGAERIALTLHNIYRNECHNSWLFVKKKFTTCEQVKRLVPSSYGSKYRRLWHMLGDCSSRYAGKIKGFGKLQQITDIMARPNACFDKRQGKEDFDFPASRHLLEHLNFRPDVIHCHNLHGGYFDLSVLAELSSIAPVVITLHDEWTYTGHCAYTLGCERWRTGCGDCPDLTIPVAIACDSTAFNCARKKDIYDRSQLYVVTPSQWLMERAKQSILSGAFLGQQVIHNGVDLTIFKPADKAEKRSLLGIPADAKVVLFAANGVRNNPLKDFGTLRAAVEIVANRMTTQPLLFIAVGENVTAEQVGNVAIDFVPYVSDVSVMASYYQAADVYVHAAVSDNYPTTVLESLSCGTPVVATAAGGIPEQIVDGVTGYLAPPKDAQSIADKICSLLIDDVKREQVAVAAADYARSHFDEHVMADEYLDLYSSILSRWSKDNK